VRINDGLGVALSILNDNIYPGQTVSIGTWSLITAGFSLMKDKQTYMASLSVSSAVSATAYSDFKTQTGLLPVPLTFGTSDVFQLGSNFIGNIYQFKLFTPGMHVFSSRKKTLFLFISHQFS